MVIRTTVRRVVLDVVVTGPGGRPATGLTKADFTVSEDGQPQRILSFDANGFTPEMDYVPVKLPPQAPNTFINLPRTPEKGPLYVLLYDLVNMDSADQMDLPGDTHVQENARQQMLKFIQSKPEGTRFAIFVRSDGLHLIQGFTSDKAKLYAALDPHSPGPHIPMVFLNAGNYGRDDRLSAVRTLHTIATYLAGLPGRKNLIWFSSGFPLSLFASDTDGPNFREETKQTMELLAEDQVALYPVDARGVPLYDSHTQLTTSPHSDTLTSPIEGAAAAAAGGSGGGTGGSSPVQTTEFVQGDSVVVGSYNVMDEMARETGGEAYYGNNDLASELRSATENGGAYYTLTYSPTNTDYDGDLRHISVELSKKGYQLSYRRFYYGLEKPAADAGEVSPSGDAGETQETARRVGDSLSANMEHGAPEAHRLIFVVQAHTEGPPAEGTLEQMSALATEPAYFKSRRRSAQAKPLPPVPLQKDLFTFDIPTRQFDAESTLDLELAIAAYDADGQMMNAVVRLARKDLDNGPDKTTAGSGESGESPRFFRIEQELEVPVAAKSVRFAVRDTTNDRIGAMEVKLPLASESEAAAGGSR